MKDRRKRLHKEPYILIAEDDKEMRSLLFYILSKYGYRVKMCVDGKELLDELNSIFLQKENDRNSIDLIISDIRMPYASGLKILKTLKTNPSFPPMILITAFGSDEIHEEAEKLGAIAVLNKPFNMDILISKIEEIIKLFPLHKNIES